MSAQADLDRYKRQAGIEGFGASGQEKLSKTAAFVAGVGGLGSSVCIYLAAAGVSHLRIVDHDEVETSNLNRQILYETEAIGGRKVLLAENRLQRLNPDIRIEAVDTTITEGNILQLVDGCDLIVDALDNFPTRYLLNKAALQKQIPFFYGSVYGLEGMLTDIIPGRTGCLRCLFPEAPPPVNTPVLGATPGVVGCIQAMEVIKYVVGVGELLANRLLLFDGLDMTFREVKLRRDPTCCDCGDVSLSK